MPKTLDTQIEVPDIPASRFVLWAFLNVLCITGVFLFGLPGLIVGIAYSYFAVSAITLV